MWTSREDGDCELSKIPFKICQNIHQRTMRLGRVREFCDIRANATIFTFKNGVTSSPITQLKSANTGPWKVWSLM